MRIMLIVLIDCLTPFRCADHPHGKLEVVLVLALLDLHLDVLGFVG